MKLMRFGFLRFRMPAFMNRPWLGRVHFGVMHRLWQIHLPVKDVLSSWVFHMKDLLMKCTNHLGTGLNRSWKRRLANYPLKKIYGSVLLFMKKLHPAKPRVAMFTLHPTVRQIMTGTTPTLS